MGSVGEDVVRLTNDPAVNVDPAWSPDGTQIVFARIAPARSISMR